MRKHDLRRADQITQAAINRRAEVTVGNVTGTLTGLIDGPNGQVTLALIVGGSRAWVPLNGDAEVTVWRAGT